MLNIKLDGKEYDLATFSDEAKERLASLQFVDAELQKLQGQVAAFKTARNAYWKALSAVLPEPK